MLRLAWQAYRRRLRWELREVECILAQRATTAVEFYLGRRH